MKILHLYSDWKWTGPAEPAIQMCKGLQDLGHDVLFAHCTPEHDNKETIASKVAEYGIQGTEQFALDRHFRPGGTVRDLFGLPRFLRQEKFDIVHMHLSHDHVFGGVCAKLLGKKRPLLVRSLHRRDVLKDSFGSRLQLKRLADGFLVFTPGFRDEYISRFQLDPQRIGILPMTVDLNKFSPDQQFSDMRSEFGIDADAPVIGIVGRFQRYRKMEVFFEAAKQVLDVVPETRFIVIGRSSKMQETVVTPCRKLGISAEVITPGYLIEKYVDTLACLDIFTLLMPGFDGTARAVREAMALGKPCVTSDFGMLPDIIGHEQGGFAVPMEADALATVWLRLIQDRELRQKMGGEAKRIATEQFRMDLVGPQLQGFYQQLLELGPK